MTSRLIVILASFVLAVLMVAAAVMFSGSQRTPTLVSAEGNEELLKEYASRDTDRDGLLDWEEALYGTDPRNPNSFSSEMTDGEAVKGKLVEPKIPLTEEPTTEELLASLTGIEAAPGTLTREFARKFLQEYIATKTTAGAPTNEEVSAFISSAITELKTEAALEKPFSATDARAIASGAGSMQTYATSIEQALLKSDTGVSGDAGDYFAAVVKKEDSKAAVSLDTLAEGYNRAANAIIASPVPGNALSAHVGLANAFASMGESIQNMSLFLEDPLRGFFGLSQYSDARIELVRAFAAYAPLMGTEGGEGTFFTLVTRSAEALAAQQAPQE